jgi:hypothetical protein
MGERLSQAAAGLSAVLEHLLLPALSFRLPLGLFFLDLAAPVRDGSAGRRHLFPDSSVRIEGTLSLLSRHNSIIACGSGAWLT